MSLLEFCQLTLFPSIPGHVLCLFTVHLAKEWLSREVLSVIRYFCILAELSDPFGKDALPMLQYILRGIKQTPAHAPRKPRLPITPAVLHLLKAAD